MRNREGIWQQISTEYRIGQLIMQMLLSSTIAMSCYGMVLGSSNGFLQAISSAIKLPILFLLTLAICLPTLYLFNLVFGARLSMQQALALVMNRHHCYGHADARLCADQPVLLDHGARL